MVVSNGDGVSFNPRGRAVMPLISAILIDRQSCNNTPNHATTASSLVTFLIRRDWPDFCWGFENSSSP